MSLESIIRKVLSAEVQETTITNEDLAPGVECDCQCGKVPCVECGKDHHKHEKEGISEDTLDEHFDDLDESAFRPPHMTKKDVDIQKAKKLMDPAKNRGDGINRIMKGMKLDKAKATKLHDLVMKKDMGEEVQIQEGVWHYPDAKDIAKFKKALSKKFIVGKEGYPAKDIIPFGDDELYDMLDDASDNNPKQDARPIFTRWINGRIRDNYAGYGKKTLAIAKQLGIREGVEQMSDENLNENSDAKRFGLSQSLVDAVASIIGGKQPTNAPAKKEDASNNKSDDGEGLDKADPKAAKKKFKDRKDKDIDNDGDTDDSDKFLHKKRKAIGKSMDKEDDADTKADPKKKKGKQEPVDTKPTMNAEAKIMEDQVPRDKDGNLVKKPGYVIKLKLGKGYVYVPDAEANRPVRGGQGMSGRSSSGGVGVREMKEEMSDEQMKKREEIMKELKKKEGYFKEKYGEKWEEVMYATATKMASK